MYNMFSDFDEYFTLKSMMKLGVTIGIDDLPPEKILLFCHIKEEIDGK